MTGDELFRLVDVTKTYASPDGPVHALARVSARIRCGLTAVVGPSGSGKSTLLNLLGGLDRPDTGAAFHMGRPVPFGDERGLRRYRLEEVGWVFQDLNLVKHQDVESNVALPLRLRGASARTARDQARRALAALGVESLASRYPHQLSRGQRQRVGVARTLCNPAAAILADEPTASLDADAAAVVFDLLRTAVHRHGKSVLIVTHDIALARKCDHYYVCDAGRLSEGGAARETSP